MSTISKSIPHFLLSSLFWKLSQPLGQNQQNSKPISDYHISMDSLGFYLSRVFLEFSPKPVCSTMVAKKFQIYIVKTTANTFESQKIEFVLFYLCPQAKFSPRFLSLSPRQTEIAHYSRTAFSDDIFSWAERGLCSWKNCQN